jgi:mannose-6-phosphate isomerase-like protein (cupin superfamily)
MEGFDTKRLPEGIDDIAPDGSNVRILLGLPRGSMAHFELAPADTSTAVTHRTVEEIWYFLAGRGEMWRKLNAHEEVVSIEPETCVTLSLGTHFQFGLRVMFRLPLLASPCHSGPVRVRPSK